MRPRRSTRREPRLPKAKGWPGPNYAFSRTSGTGRLAGGGLFWTDYIYDDHGTTTASPGDPSVTAGSPSFGTYTYPNGPAAKNGADIFRAAVLRRGHASYWRVDWNTLASAKVPIAEWTFDRDDKASTGASRWPAKAGATSPGIDTALVMSSHGAQVIDVATGKVRKRLPVKVDLRAQSFVVRIPGKVLKPRGTWRIRLAAGLANPAGTAFVSAADALPTQTDIYNVTFRTPGQEKPSDNFWNDMSQTSALATGNVTRFSHLLRWSALAHHRRTPQPLLRGWSDRWYISRVSLGPGIVTSATTIEDQKANYLGRIQSYGLYVPKSYRPGRRSPLTFLLHSLTQDHNQYAATTPNFSQQACEDRDSICATTLGRGPDGFYYGTAQLDFWQVWHQIAHSFTLNPNRTVISGYSMGGIGTNEIAMAHPDLFARAVTLAGAVGVEPSLQNLRWVPMYQAGGAEDELVPVTVQREQANRLKQLGFRYRWLLYPVMDHVVYELADKFMNAAAYMRHNRRVVNPGHFSYLWSPHDSTKAFPKQSATGLAGFRWTDQPKLGIGITGDYWLRHLKARHRAADTARVAAFSGERPDRTVTTHRHSYLGAAIAAEPAAINSQTWTRGHRGTRRPVLRLHLANVKSLRVLLGAAGFRHLHTGRLVVTSDGPAVIHLGGRTVHVSKGRHVVRFIA